MALTLRELKTVMAPLSQIGKGELSFDIEGTAITLRALTPQEELHVQRYARAALAEGDAGDQTTIMEYLDRFRYMSLGYSIVQIGSLDFRKVETIETGEKLANGTAIKVKKHEALIDVISTWSRNMAVAVFRKFGELSYRVEMDVEKVITFDEVDYDTEITRLEERLADLKEQKSRHEFSLRDPRTEARDKVLNSGSTAKIQEPVTKPVPETFPKPVESASDTVEVPEMPRQIVEEDDSPEDEDEAILPSPVPVPVPEPKARRSVFTETPAPARPPVPEQTEDLLPNVSSSFGDVSNPDVLAAEEARIRDMRRSRAPHVSAREAFQEIQKDSDVVETMSPQPSGKLGGVDVYRMPTQNLSDRKPGPVRAPGPNFRPNK